MTVDAHPTEMIRAYGGVWRNRMQAYDHPGSNRGDYAALAQPTIVSPQPAVKVFDDRNSYYDPVNPWGSVIVPNTGTQIVIKNYSAQGNFMQVVVQPAK